MKNIFRKILPITLIALLLLAMVGCGNTSSSSSSADATPTIDKIKKSGKLIVGTAADYPPYEFYTEKNGKTSISGFDMEIAKAIAKDLGVKLEIKDMKFDGLLPALKTNSVDMVIGGMAPTEERKKSVDFSEPYYKAKQSILIRKEDESKFKTVADLKGKIIGAQKSSTQEKIAQTEIENPNLVSIPVFTDLILELRTKKIDALVCENTVAIPYTIKYSNLKLVNINFKESRKDSAIAINKGKQDLVKRINKVISQLNKENKINTWLTQYSNIASKGIKEN